MPRLAVVVPCYNEAARLDVAAFRRFTESRNDLQFVFVNDGSSDKTSEVLHAIAESSPETFLVVDRPQNAGKAEAVRQGFLAAFQLSPEFIAFWDADLATPLYEIDAFIDLLDSRPNVAMVFGSRVRLMGRTISRRASRHYVGRISATLISLTLKLPVYDTQCGAKMFRNTPTLQKVFSAPFTTRWIFDVEIIARFMAAGEKRTDIEAKIYELPLREWRDVAGSKVGFFDFFRSARDLWTIHRAYLR